MILFRMILNDFSYGLISQDRYRKMKISLVQMIAWGSFSKPWWLFVSSMLGPSTMLLQCKITANATGVQVGFELVIDCIQLYVNAK